MRGTSFNRPREADFFARQIIQNGWEIFFEFSVERTVSVNHRFGNLGKERFGQAEFASEASRASNNHATHGVAFLIAGHNTVSNEKRGRARVIADNSKRREFGKHFGFG